MHFFFQRMHKCKHHAYRVPKHTPEWAKITRTWDQLGAHEVPSTTSTARDACGFQRGGTSNQVVHDATPY